jgi:predicted nucleic-acid-binding protein
MRITVDTNILIRALVRDDKKQAKSADRLLKEADLIAISLASLCEFVWVLRRVYNLGHTEIAMSLQALLNTANVAVNRAAVEAGLAMLTAGGDFADGIIAFEGSWLGGEAFVSFDKKAVALLEKHGRPARLLK